MTTITDGAYHYTPPEGTKPMVVEVVGRFAYFAGEPQALVVSRLPGKWARLIEVVEPSAGEPIASVQESC